MDIKIVQWKDSYAQDYIDLAIEWLEKYVSVEPGDLEIIEHPYEAVLNPGGMIWFAIADDKPIGTVTMIKTDDSVYELAKLAVKEQYKGLKIGDKLMNTAIEFARENKSKVVYLFTNHKLVPAIKLYYKCGFVDVPLVDNEYIESDMKMELYL